jgi:diguanylate cyclase (GGDEF)-like protein
MKSSVLGRLLSQPVHRLLILSFLFVAIVPIAILGFELYKAAWSSAWREIHEKHQLLAENLASPISIYIKDHRTMLALLTDELMESPSDTDSQEILESVSKSLPGFRSLAVVDSSGNTRALVHEGTVRAEDQRIFAEERAYLDSMNTGEWALSSVKPSPVNGEPALLLASPMSDSEGARVGVLIGELRLELIERVRQQIRFGEKGHSAIVDENGRVIAHPSAEWTREMRDLSDLPVVREMMAGKSGVTEFFSPFVGMSMVAGYATVPEIGWGVMVPQPKSEIEAQVHALLYAHLAWGLLGLTTATLLSLFLVRWITKPIDQLAAAAETLNRDELIGDLPNPPAHAPRELRSLWTAFRGLITGLQNSRQRETSLNLSLQSRVEEATKKLRDANRRLEELATSDHLTKLCNRRHFENTLHNMLNRRSSDTEPVCIMLIDLDNFKEINDHYGHVAGDAVLVQIAGFLENSMRAGDLVARYGGDEFVAHMRCSSEVGTARAREIRAAIENREFDWREQKMRITVSVGLLYGNVHEQNDVETLLHRVDTAMYEAKRKGRNLVVEVSC